MFFISQGGEPKIEKCPFDRYNIRGAKDDANRDKRYNKLTQIIVSCEPLGCLKRGMMLGDRLTDELVLYDLGLCV